MIKERVSIFIDGSNLYHNVKSLFPDKKPMSFNFEKFIRFLLKGRELVSIYYYNSPVDREKDEDGYRKQQKFFDKIRRIPKFNLLLCRMQKRKVDNVIIYEVKEDDIHLAVDMVKLAYNNQFDSAILVSTDGDFVPAIESVKEIGKKVESIGFENRFSWHLKQKSSTFRKIRKNEITDMFDRD
jgi:uncharacterized LabA/DUF88 family protein